MRNVVGAVFILSTLSVMVSAGDAPPPAPPLVEEASKPAVVSKFGAELYGYIRLEGSYDTSRVYTGNYAAWVESQATNRHDNEFNMTVFHSRLGLNLKGPDVGNAKSGGKLEIDFAGGTVQNKPAPMLRHGYLELTWKDLDLSLLAGQTSDVISPLNPSTLNYTVAWFAGNIGYRRPQVRVTKGFTVNDKMRLEVAAALTRTIGDITANSHVDTGADSGFPTMQGRVALTFPAPLLADKKATVGLSAHWGQEEYDLTATNRHETLDTYSINVDVDLPIVDKLGFKGEAWIGENLDAFYGGINQGVNVSATRFETVRAYGGWGAVSYGPVNDWRFLAGIGVDNPANGDLSSGGRAKNVYVFGNAEVDVHENVRLSIELSYLNTDYKDQPSADAVRLATGFTFTF